jgi:hypothetical protein
MPETTGHSGNLPDSVLAPPILLQRRSQLSLRALLFLQMQAAMIMLFVTLAIGQQKATIPVVVSTFIGVTFFTCLVGTLLSLHFAMRWKWAIGPAMGTIAGLIASSLALSPSANFERLMVSAFAASTFLIAMCIWQGRYLSQDEG